MKLFFIIPLIFTITNLPYRQNLFKGDFCEKVSFMLDQREAGFQSCKGEKREGNKYACTNPFPGSTDGYVLDTLSPSVVFLMGTFHNYDQARNQYFGYIKQLRSCLGKDYKINEHQNSSNPDVLVTRFQKVLSNEPAVMVRLNKNIDKSKVNGTYYDVYLAFEGVSSPGQGN